MDERRLKSLGGPFVLFVSLALPGGVERFVWERRRELREGGGFALVLRPSEAGSRARVQIWTDVLGSAGELRNLHYRIPAELPQLRGLLGSLPIEHVEFQHFLHLDARVIEMVRGLGRPYDVFLHDFAWVCPRITLTDPEGRYCGEPELAACEACVRRNGSHLGERLGVQQLRQRSEKWLAQARKVWAPSQDTAGRYRRHFPKIEIGVRPHGPALTAAEPRPSWAAGQPVRVALVGALTAHKGLPILLACARDAARRALPLEFVVIGFTEADEELLRTGRVFITGRFNEGQAPELLRRERPHVGFLASTWPETWCYALDPLVHAALPVVCFDLGAQAERLRTGAAGVLLALGTEAAEINNCFLRIVCGNDAGGARHPVGPSSAGAPAPIPAGGERRGARSRASNFEKATQEMNDLQAKRELQAKDGLTASVQVLALPAGLYLFSVTAATVGRVEGAGKINLPALHVGLGPGVRTDLVEFVQGPVTSGTWLFAQGDMLVAKVRSPGATLILTSIRGPGGEALAINLERLDGRARTQARQGKTGAAAPAVAAGPAQAPADDGAAADGLPLEIKAHIRAQGDRTFARAPWAGRLGRGMWLESFSVRPIEGLRPTDIEYKGLTGSGFETPWVQGDERCGTQGLSVPLIGFAVRLKPGPGTEAYDCEYSGYFQSGAVRGPLRNGSPCRSTAASDPLEGIQIRIVKRAGASASRTAAPTTGAEAISTARGQQAGRSGARAAPAPMSPRRGEAAKAARPKKAGSSKAAQPAKASTTARKRSARQAAGKSGRK